MSTAMAQPPLRLPLEHRKALEPYLPPRRSTFLPPHPSHSHFNPNLETVPPASPLPNTTSPNHPSQARETRPKLPHLTLTYATSIDAQISYAPGKQTILSGLESKSMTHYLRWRHDAILVGVGTMIADNPGLASRLVLENGEGEGEGMGEGMEGEECLGDGLEHQPRPLILDPSARWRPNGDEKLFQNAKEGMGREPWWLVPSLAPSHVRQLPIARYHNDIKAQGLDWKRLLECLGAQGIRSVMVEGGGEVIRDLLREENHGLVSSVVITVAPVWLGRGGVEVIPEREEEEGGHWVGVGVGNAVGRLRHVKWVGMGSDVVCCGFLNEGGG